MNQKNFQLASEVFRRAIGAGPLESTLLATAIALDESRAALRWAGHPDDALLKELATLQAQLEQLASGSKPAPTQ